MSRIGNKFIIIPKNINIKVKYNKISVKGKLGKLKIKINKNIKILIKENKINLINKNNKYKGLHGLYRMLIYNMIYGVTKGFKKQLELIGVGYKAEVYKKGRILILNLGYSHNIIFHVCKEINITIDYIKGANYIINLHSIDNQLLGIVASKIRSLKKPDRYKGKGIRYKNENIILKPGKTV
ncbi:MAG: 50S ribosomal protein L6 [Candidatus Shikimatogenerans bostrichidophilus]|nr:MAG: 50S ribosomal protein L6 [Candidatus Shikimatogenerans bostrichidophilus]